MFSPPSTPNTLWTNLALTFILLLLILWAVLSLWPDPKTARKIKNKMTWHLVTTIEKESIDKETRLENLKIRDWNPFIKKETITEDPTYDDVLRHRPHIRFKTKSPVQKWGEELISDFSYQDGDTWSMDDPAFDWNGDPENVAPEKGSTALSTSSRPTRITPTLRLRFGTTASATRGSSKKKERITNTPACANSSIPSSM